MLIRNLYNSKRRATCYLPTVIEASTWRDKPGWKVCSTT